MFLTLHVILDNLSKPLFFFFKGKQTPIKCIFIAYLHVLQCYVNQAIETTPELHPISEIFLLLLSLGSAYHSSLITYSEFLRDYLMQEYGFHHIAWLHKGGASVLF